jgi:AraC-like DNA-binding protein
MSSRPSEFEIQLVPAAYGARFVALVESRGIAAADVLAGISVTRPELDDPNRRMSLADLARMFENGTRLTGDTSLGLELGLSLKASSHGMLGVALLTCATIRDTMAVGERYGATRMSPWHMELVIEGELAILRFVEKVSLGTIRLVALEAVLGAVISIGEFMSGFPFTHPDLEFWYAAPEQPHHARFADRLPRVRYDAPAMEARFPAVWLERPLVLHEPVTHREAVTVLEQDRKLLLEDADLVARTRAVLADPAAGFPDLDETAVRLAVSSRTLRRHLSQAGTTFQSLRDEVRRTRSTALLEQSRLSIEEVARELGFADAAGFVRAFQRWTGETPASYRLRARRS